jgi:hypothetical protein
MGTLGCHGQPWKMVDKPLRRPPSLLAASHRQQQF